MSPFKAWVVLKGLETLDMRARRQSENALEVGKFVESRVPRILHPGLASHPHHNLAMRQLYASGPIFAFILYDLAQAISFLYSLELVYLSLNIVYSRFLSFLPSST